MKQGSKRNIEGVTGRPRRRNLGDFNATRPLQESTITTKRNQIGFSKEKSIDEAAKGVDASKLEGEDLKQPNKGKLSRFAAFRAKRKAKKEATKAKWANRHPVLRIGRRVFSTAGLIAILLVAVIAFKSWLALHNIIDRSGGEVAAVRDHIDKIGRINVLLVGIGGEQHTAGNLADSIIIASIDPFANDMVMVSVPRDLYVSIPEYGSSKINAAHVYGEENDYKGGGVALLSKTITENLGIDIHYFIRLDFQGFVQAVDTVGGIDVNLPQRIYDPNFDWEYGANALDLQQGVNHLDGQTALLLARARGANGGSIGLERSDFARADHQRLMLVALKDKVLSAGTYSNPLKVTGLIDTVGSHLRTNLNPPNDMLDLYDIISRIGNDKIASISLSNDQENYLVSGMVDGASVLLPRTGDFAEIQAYLKSLMPDAFLRRESPKVDVYNGSGYEGVATTQSELLKSNGYNIGKVENADKQDYTETVIYDLNGSAKPHTKALLEKQYGVKMLPKEQLPTNLQTDADFVIIVGQDNV